MKKQPKNRLLLAIFALTFFIQVAYPQQPRLHERQKIYIVDALPDSDPMKKAYKFTLRDAAKNPQPYRLRCFIDASNALDYQSGNYEIIEGQLRIHGSDFFEEASSLQVFYDSSQKKTTYLLVSINEEILKLRTSTVQGSPSKKTPKTLTFADQVEYDLAQAAWDQDAIVSVQFDKNRPDKISMVTVYIDLPLETGSCILTIFETRFHEPIPKTPADKVFKVTVTLEKPFMGKLTATFSLTAKSVDAAKDLAKEIQHYHHVKIISIDSIEDIETNQK